MYNSKLPYKQAKKTFFFINKSIRFLLSMKIDTIPILDITNIGIINEDSVQRRCSQFRRVWIVLLPIRILSKWNTEASIFSKAALKLHVLWKRFAAAAFVVKTQVSNSRPLGRFWPVTWFHVACEHIFQTYKSNV